MIISPSTIIRRINSTTTLTIRFLPTTASSTVVEYCLYTNRKVESVSEESIQQIQTILQTRIEDMEMQQRRLRLGDVPSSNHVIEQFEQLLTAHREVERSIGHEVSPAAQKQSRSIIGLEDDDCELMPPQRAIELANVPVVCRKLEEKPSVCKANADGLLDW